MDATSKMMKATDGRQLQVGKSSEFIELPMDLIFEISVELHPLDLLQLSRVSKLFRSIYMSRQAQTIWRAALKQIVPELPPCAPDLNEAQYASLLFESVCCACGYGPVRTVTDYGLRLNLCARCWEKNLASGFSLRNAFKGLPDIIYSLVPRRMDRGALSYDGSHPEPASCANNGSHQYYKADFEMVVHRYFALQGETELLKAFIEERQQISSDMMQHGCELHSWNASFQRDQATLGFERLLTAYFSHA